MIASKWENISLAGSFLLGAAFMSLIILRLARVIAEFLTGIERRHKEKRDHEPDRRDHRQ